MYSHHRCRSDGYPLRDVTTHDSTSREWMCTNPWHPKDPGPCPQCGSRIPKAPFLAEDIAECRRCRHHWLPLMSW